MRRLKVITLLFVITLVLFLFYRSSSTPSASAVDDFYHKTKTALDHDKEDHTAHILKASQVKDKNTNTDNIQDVPGTGTEKKGKAEEGKGDTKQRLQDAAKEAKDKANAKAPKPDPPSSVIGVGSASGEKNGEAKVVGDAGRKKWNTGEEQKIVKEDKEDESEEDHEVELELNSILKKAPGMASLVEWLCNTFWNTNRGNTNLSQSSSSPSRTVHIPRAQRRSCSRNISSIHRLTLWNSTSTPSA